VVDDITQHITSYLLRHQNNKTLWKSVFVLGITSVFTELTTQATGEMKQPQ